MTNISGYEIRQKLYESRRTMVYRAIRAQDPPQVILKILHTPYPTPEELAAFKREFALTQKLELDGVVKMYSLEKYDHTLMMCIEDFGGMSLAAILSSRRLALEEFLFLAVQVTTTLGEIHHQQVLHKDINPSNIIWNPETNQVKIVDFGIASVVSYDQPSFLNPNVLEGTLAYMAPEQTGRMNREIDYRTDFYSLGVTFYEMLLGFLPFRTTDTMELIHSHLAKTPRPPYELHPDVPKPVSQIIMKLLAKTAEDRYQSAHGLLSDLQKCYDQLKFAGQIQFVAVGQDDVSDRFQIPQQLYGRTEQYATLLKAFERVASQGAREFLLVSGYAGMGKSALTHELYKPVVARRGYFVTVKFDQVKRDTPYLPLIQALQALVQQILTESEHQIAAWKERLLSSVGDQGQVLTTLIPGLELVIGEQPPVPELSPEESQNRLHLLLGDFLQAFIAAEHPLVMFLDDLDWADAASLKLLQFLMTAPNIRHLMIIGAYQETEMAPTPSFQAMLDECQQAGVQITRIVLMPLSVNELNQLLTDTFHCDPDETRSLAQLVFEKTYGTPFAVKEFLKSLYREQLLAFDTRTGRWTWNPEQIQGMALTDNVVRFMSARIQKLPDTVRELLQFAACIGSRFDLHTLAQAREIPEKETAAELEAAIQEGLVVPADDAYNYVQYLNPEELRVFAPQVNYDFVHNRIREAAETMTPEHLRAEFHLKIGRHLLQCDIHKEARADHISDIVNHLNMGTHLLHTKTEQVKLARLNLLVGKRAKALAAYNQALRYFTAGIALLKKKGWQEHYELTFQLYKEWTEVESLCGNFDQAEHLISLIINQIKDDREKADILVLQVKLYNFKGHYAEAVQVGKEALQILGVPVPQAVEIRQALNDEVSEIRKLLKTKPLSSLLHEPELTIPEARIVIRLLDHLIISTFQTDRQLYYVVVAKIVNLALKYGHTSDAAYGFAQYGVMLGALWGYYKAGHEFGKFAVKLSEKYNNPSQKCKALCAMAGELTPWVRHMQYTPPIENDAYQVGLYAGELQFAGFALLYKVMNWFSSGVNLRQILAGVPNFLKFATRTKNLTVVDGMIGYRLAIQNLCGLTSDMLSFDTDELKERQLLDECQKHQSSLAVCLYYIIKTQLLFLYDVPGEALYCAQQAEPYLGLISNMIARAEHTLYLSLCLAALIPDAEPDEQQRYWDQFRANRHQMEVWAENCRENFQHKLLLLQAEEARLNGEYFTAMTLYRQAEQAAKDHNFPHVKALIHELTAKFYLEHNFEDFARLHLMKAHGNYTMWGATRKVEHLGDKYAKFFAAQARDLPRSGTHSTTRRGSTEMPLPTTEQGVSLLDLHTVMKASQTFSGEIVLSELLKRMMRIVIENAGAQTGWLLLENQDKWAIEAEGMVESEEVMVLQSIPLKPDDGSCESPIPWAIVQYVIRTGEPIVLNDASQEGNFADDICILKRKTKSVLCTPLLKQGKLIGILYLENNLAPGAFTSDRLEVLKMLSSQMAISIENATLYKHLQEALEQQIELSNEQVELTNAYSRFVPTEFISLLGKKSITDVQLGDQVEQEITVMFSDIRGFTPLSEHMTPQQNFNFINSYLSQMSPIIRKYHGFIDKYIGDAIMALFPTNADDAVQASIAMLKGLVRYNQGRKRAGYQWIQIGIGLNTGELMLGTVGDQARMDGTVISDAVNLASRVEGMTKVYGVSLLISETTYFQLHDPAKYAIRIIDQVQAKGKSEPVTIFEVFDGDPPQEIELKQQTLMLFKQGFKLYHQAKFAGATSLFSDVLQVNPEVQMQQIAEAKEFFQEILHVNPDDKVALIYVQRCENIQQYGMADEWKGVWAWIESLRNRSI